VVKDTKYENLREDFGPIAFFPCRRNQVRIRWQFLIRSKLPEAQVTGSNQKPFRRNQSWCQRQLSKLPQDDQRWLCAIV
jgi:hypothetical protein